MSQTLLYFNQRHTGRDQQIGTAVPQIMESDSPQMILLDDTLKLF